MNIEFIPPVVIIWIKKTNGKEMIYEWDQKRIFLKFIVIQLI